MVLLEKRSSLFIVFPNKTKPVRRLYERFETLVLKVQLLKFKVMFIIMPKFLVNT